MRIPGPGVSFPLFSMLLACGAADVKLIDEDGGMVIDSVQELEEACDELEIAGEEVFEVVFEAADCRIPPPETQGMMALEFDDSLDAELAFRALEDGEMSFLFAAMGDNDSSDCYHEEFVFEVTIPYVSID